MLQRLVNLGGREPVAKPTTHMDATLVLCTEVTSEAGVARVASERYRRLSPGRFQTPPQQYGVRKSCNGSVYPLIEAMVLFTWASPKASRGLA